MGKLIDRVGQVYGWLTVQRQTTPPLKAYADIYRLQAWWCCRCRCGREVPVAARNLRDGNMLSCGCFRRAKHRLRCHYQLGGLLYGQPKITPANYDSLAGYIEMRKSGGTSHHAAPVS